MTCFITASFTAVPRCSRHHLAPHRPLFSCKTIPKYLRTNIALSLIMKHVTLPYCHSEPFRVSYIILFNYERFIFEGKQEYCRIRKEIWKILHSVLMGVVLFSLELLNVAFDLLTVMPTQDQWLLGCDPMSSDRLMPEYQSNFRPRCQ